MRIRYLFAVVIICVLVSACNTGPTALPMTPTSAVSPTPSPTPTPLPEGLIVVDSAVFRQTIKDVGGGNFIHEYSGYPEVLDPIGAMNVETLNPQYARVRMGLPDWEPRNDNDDPDVQNDGAFYDTEFNKRTFQLMQQFEENGVTIITTIWDVPDWLVAVPESERSRFIHPDSYPELLECMTSWLTHARDAYGVTVDYVSFNEPIIGVNIALGSMEQRAIIKKAGPHFEQAGLPTKWLLGDCAGMKDCYLYADYIQQDADVLPYLGPLAVHSWGILELDEKNIIKLADFAEEHGFELWVTEAGWDPFLYQRSEEFPTWNNALRLAGAYNRILQLSRATVVQYWEFLGNDYSLNDGKSPYPALQMVAQIDAAFPAETKIMQTAVNTPRVYAVAAQNPETTILHIVYTGTEARNVDIAGLPDGTYTRVVSTEGALLKAAESVEVAKGILTLDLPPESVILLTLD